MNNILLHKWSNWYIFHWDVKKTLENILVLSWWNDNEKQIFIDLFYNEEKNIDNSNIYIFEKKLKNKLDKEQINIIFLGNTIFWTLHEFFYDIEIVKKYYNDYLNSKERKKILINIEK